MIIAMERQNFKCVSDIKENGFVRYLPPRWQSYYLLLRLDRPIGWVLLYLPCLWGLVGGALIQERFDVSALSYAALFLIGAIMMRGAGCIVNDLWDRDLDRQVARTARRPLASGAISTRATLIALLILLIFSAALLFFLPWQAAAIAVSSSVLVVLYPLMKRWTWWPQLFLGLTFNIGVLVGYFAIAEIWHPAILLLYLAGIFWTLGYDTIYALQDIEDDVKVGIKSTARLFGKKSRTAIAGFYAATIFLFALFLHSQNVNILAVIVFLILPTGHFIWQIASLNSDNPQNILTRFKSNGAAGTLMLLVLIASVLI
jgi:4-hydroxybenzoate polyprenyltransferase